LFAILIMIHVIICGSMILTILMQSSKGEGLAGAFGGTSLTGAVFGGRGAASFLSKATSVLAIAFMISCLALTFVSPAHQIERAGSAVKKEMQNQQLPGGQPTTLPGEGTTQQPAGGGTTVPPASGQQPTSSGTQKPPQGGGK
jgi:preprotein translocase subunit SecG